MQPSRFTVRVPLPEQGQVFLLNTLTDAQLLVTPDVLPLLDRAASGETFSAEEQDTLTVLADQGFLVESREAEQASLLDYFASVREDGDTLRVTVLTTLQCNFACDYCLQGDHGDHNLFAHKMSLEKAAEVAGWLRERLSTVRPSRLALTFFGGEPLLNLPVIYYLAEQGAAAAAAIGARQTINIVTNGLLLSTDVVDRLLPFGLSGVKVTLDGDKDTHDRMRPLRGRQGTFDRIVENVRKVAHRVPITIGGNFDADTVASYPALLDFLRQQEFADKLAKINFKPIIKTTPASPAPPKGFIPLTAVSASGQPLGDKPLGGACMTTAGAGGSACDSCGLADEQMTFLRDETRKRGFPTVDGVHMGPCEIHRKHAHTVSPDGSLYACPGFAADESQALGRIGGSSSPLHADNARRFDALGAYRNCGDCAFIPVCAGGCSVASHAELGDMNTPTCHKPSFESAVAGLARAVAAGPASTLN